MRKILIALFTISGFAATAQTGAYNAQCLAYIRQYKAWAIEEQQRTGVPAAITLAQGIHETQAGQSELATEANNHFGIKCKKEWQGETYAHTDDAPNECFRKYSKAYDSYKDHSDYLKKSARYNSCFQQSVTDYAAWATELKRCGYATNPKYAQKLIRIIEDFHLQDYTYAAMKNEPAAGTEVYLADAGSVTRKKETPVPAEVVPEQDMPVVSKAEIVREVNAPETEVRPELINEPVEDQTPVYGQTMQRNGLKGFYAHKGDVLLEYAIRYNLRYARILELNDLPDAPLEADMFVYLEWKHATGRRKTHLVKDGETMVQVAQAEGMQLKQLRSLNQLDPDENAAPGTSLNLQVTSSTKPAVSGRNQQAVARYNSNEVAAVKTQPAPAPVRTEAPVPEKEITRPVPPPVVAKAKPAVITAEEPAPATQPEAEPSDDPTAQITPEPAPVVVAKAEPAPKPIEKPRPRPISPPKQKTYTIADELAVGEEPQKFSPRYVHPVTTPPPAATQTPAVTTVTEVTPPVVAVKEPVKEVKVVKNEPAVREEDLPQDEFSKLKRQLDKAVYGSNKRTTSNIVVTEERPAYAVNQPSVAAPATTIVAPNTVAAASGTGYHIVKNGETAFSIAKQYNLSMKELRELNNLNFEAIKTGQKLRVK